MVQERTRFAGSISTVIVLLEGHRKECLVRVQYYIQCLLSGIELYFLTTEAFFLGGEGVVG